MKPFDLPRFRNYLQVTGPWHCSFFILAKTQVVIHHLTVIIYYPKWTPIVYLSLHFEWTLSESPPIPVQHILRLCGVFGTKFVPFLF